MQRRDLYGECNTKGAPVDLFTAECCMTCVNPECTRSSFGKSKFDIRVSTWYERLFANPSRMELNDPRYKDIASKMFMPISPPISVNTWVDPQEIQEVPPKVSQETTTPVISSPSVVVEPPKETTTPKNLSLINTPVQQGQMLGGKEAKDLWEAPAPTSDTVNVKVVKTGEKIKLGT